MSETSDPPTQVHTDQESQVHNDQESQVNNDQTAQSSTVTKPSPSLMIILTLVMKIITMVFLIVSMSVLASNNVTLTDFYGLNLDETVHFNDIYAYRYALSVAVIVLAYILIELPFLIYKVIVPVNTLSNNSILVLLAFYADKVILTLLATGLGAAFGYTVDPKRLVDSIDDDLQDYGETEFSPLRSKLDDFFNRAYIPITFLLFAVLTSLGSSVLSSLALIKNKNK